MQSVLVLSKDKKISKEYINSLCKELGIGEFETTRVENKTLGIEDVRAIQKNITLKPVVGTHTAIILKITELITQQAQNALLKILEEPPEHTLIIISAISREQFLPTILSRCKIVKLNKNQEKITEQKNTQDLDLLFSLLEINFESRLKIAQDITKTKEDALVWLEKMILSLRELLIDKELHASHQTLQLSQLLNYLRSFQKSHKILSTTNVNPRLILENLFLNL